MSNFSSDTKLCVLGQNSVSHINTVEQKGERNLLFCQYPCATWNKDCNYKHINVYKAKIYSVSLIQNKPCSLPHTKYPRTVVYFKQRIIKNCLRSIKYTSTKTYIVLSDTSVFTISIESYILNKMCLIIIGFMYLLERKTLLKDEFQVWRSNKYFGFTILLSEKEMAKKLIS